ncbi:asparagine synthase-related protein [Streptomyces sp. NPDC093097]|uniref:asparagine synthase-related protein n=1 Tax=Streptomyces sp. NPDC093097 TaxID=3366027 RepID=UPI0037FF321B
MRSFGQPWGDKILGASWFVAFPGNVGSAYLSNTALTENTSTVRHQSGSTWLLAKTLHASLLVAEAGARRLALFGEFHVDAGCLARLLDRYNDADGVMTAAHEFAGSFHILYTDGQATHIQGSASGLRQVFYVKRADGPYAVSDSVEVLARLTGAAPRLEMAAWGLIHPGLDYGLTQETCWTGVRRLPADQRLQVCGDRVTTTTWWRPPAAALSIAEGAPALRTALEEAVSVRAATAEGLSADLSGGMDSTSLCFLLAEQGAQFQAFVEQTIDPNHDDAHWAAIAAKEIGRDLTVLGPEDVPGPYDGIWNPECGLDQSVPYGLGEPYTLIRNRTRKAAMSTVFAATGATVHLGGFGGDELFTVAPSYFSDLYATSPLKALRGIRPLARLRRWTLPAAARALSSQPTYRQWLDEELRTLHHPRPDVLRPTVNWGPQLHMPPWATTGTADAVRALIYAQADIAPQAPDRATHTALAGQRIGGHRLAPLRALMEHQGIQLSLPYMDDRVLQASLSISRAESLPGTSYKPILRTAMQKNGPKTALARSTKGEFSMSVHHGLARNRKALLAMFEDSLLAEQGLVDLACLRSRIKDNMRPQHETAALELTIGAEAWMQVVAGATAPKNETEGLLMNRRLASPC